MRAFRLERLLLGLNEEGTRKLLSGELALLGVDVEPATRCLLDVGGVDYYLAFRGEWSQEQLLASAHKKRLLVEGAAVVYDEMENA